MKRFVVLFLITALVVGLAIFVADYFTVRPVSKPPTGSDPALDFLKLPPGYGIQLFADDLGGTSLSRPGPNPGARLMTVKGDTVYVAVPGEGSVIALHDRDNNGKAEARTIFADGLSRPHNIDFSGNWAFIAAENGIFRGEDKDQDHVLDEDTLDEIITLPSGGHWTRTVKVIDDLLYVSVGSSCNACNESNEWRATIHECELDGSRCQLFARGLRNTVDFVQHNGKIYGTDNGRDGLGNTVPPDEVNIIEREQNYGWPICYGKNIHDTEFDKNTYIRNPCMEPFEKESFLDLPAHVAPLGLAFHKNKLFIAYHGSWNADPPVGYKVVMVDPSTGVIEDFITGFFDGTKVFGRPVGIAVFGDSLLISDDVAGRIYRVFSTGE